MVAATVALVTFFTDKYAVGAGFWSLVGIGMGSLALASFKGGKGIDEIIRNGHGGLWKIRTSRRYFAAQTGLALLGFSAILASLVFGLTSDRRTENSQKSPDQLARILKRQASVRADLDHVRSQLQRDMRRDMRLRHRVRALERRR